MLVALALFCFGSSKCAAHFPQRFFVTLYAGTSVCPRLAAWCPPSSKVLLLLLLLLLATHHQQRCNSSISSSKSSPSARVREWCRGVVKAIGLMQQRCC
jgi:hypothetical protein